MSSDNRHTPALRPEVADAIRRISILCPDNAGLFNPSPMFDGCKVCLKPECLHEPPPDAGIIVAELERLAAENAGLKAAREWRPIADAPRDGTPVLTIDKFDGQEVGCNATCIVYSFTGRSRCCDAKVMPPTEDAPR